MPSAEDWCRQQLANLQLADRRLDALTEIRAHLTAQPSSAHWLSVREIFNCLDGTGNDQPEAGSHQQNALACDILAICMSNLAISGSESAENREYLLKCIQHRAEELRVFGLGEMERHLAAGSSDFVDDHLLLAVIELLRDPSEHVAIPALRILSLLLSSNRFELDDQSAAIRAQLLQIGAASSLAKCRVYELAVTVATKSERQLQAVDFLLLPLQQDLETADCLLQLNVLGFLADLAQCDWGCLYLENAGIFERITRFVAGLPENPLRGVLVPGYMRFFGALATAHPRRVIGGFPQMIGSLFECLEAGELEVMPVALDTLAHLCGSVEGAELMHGTYGEELRRALVGLREGLKGWPSALQVRVMGCWEQMFGGVLVGRLAVVGVAEEELERVSAIRATWLTWLTAADHQQLSLLHDLSRNPFPDIKLAALRLVSAICSHSWGQQALANTAGFAELLLDRHGEFDKDVKLEKWSIIRRLAAGDCFAEPIVSQLREYEAQGAFYVTGIVEVAVEDGGS